MLISNATTRALDEIGARERDVLQAFAPGAKPERPDAGKAAAPIASTDPLSVAPPLDSYFVTGDSGGRMLFTRDGSFSLHGGTLVDSQGREILGYANEGTVLSALRADPVDVALGYTAGARIEPDGTLSYLRNTIDPRTGAREAQRAVIGRLALARFAAGTQLRFVDPQHGAAPAGIAPHIGRAGDGNFGALTPNARESSGVDLDLGLQRLEEAYLALDAIRAAGAAKGGIEKTTMDLLK